MKLLPYKKKPKIEMAVRFFSSIYDEYPQELKKFVNTSISGGFYYACKTVNGSVEVKDGDWIIVREDEAYPVTNKVFTETYESEPFDVDYMVNK